MTSCIRGLRNARAGGNLCLLGIVWVVHGEVETEKILMAEESRPNRHEHLEEELEDLRKELESFQEEKERVRAIVGKIGGVPKTQAHLMNILFIVIIAVSVIVSLVAGEHWRWLMIEVATVTLSLKIIYLIHSQMRIAHFEFWILSSLEWRINEIMKQLRELQKERTKE